MPESIDYQYPFPSELFEDAPEDAELAARLARFRTLMELGFFGLQTTVDLSLGHYKGRFNAGVRKRFAGTYGNTEGCSAGDIELAAELIGKDNFDAIYDYENRTTQP